MKMKKIVVALAVVSVVVAGLICKRAHANRA